MIETIKIVDDIKWGPSFEKINNDFQTMSRRVHLLPFSRYNRIITILSSLI